MRALERGCFWEAEEITPGFRGLPLPGVNSHPTLPGFSTLMGFQPGLMGAKDIRQETNKKMDSLHSRLRWIYICLSCLLPRHPFFFFLHRICTIHFKDMSIDRNYRPICCRLIPYGRVSHRGSFTIKFVRSVCFWTFLITLLTWIVGRSLNTHGLIACLLCVFCIRQLDSVIANLFVQKKTF